MRKTCQSGGKMGTHAVCKPVSSLTLLSLTVLHATRCCLANSTFSQTFKKGEYSRLVQDIKNSPIAIDKIPPRIEKFIPFDDLHVADRPAYDTSNAVHVDLTLYPVDIRRLDPLHQVLEMNTFIRLRWTDEDLAWNSSSYGGVDVVELPPSSLWTPTLSVLNGVEDNEIVAAASVPLILTKNGSIFYSFSANLKTSCPLDLRFFPFDRQTCDVFIYSIKQTGGHITPTEEKRESMMKTFDAGGEWILLSIKQMTVKGVLHLKDFNNTQITLNLERKTTFYTVSVVLPMGLFSFMNCLVFLIPPESGEKISFLVSIFISNAIFANFINGNMPRGLGDEMPLVMDFLAFMWLWSVIAFLGTIYVIKKFRDEQQCVVRRQEVRRHTLFNKVGSIAGLLDMETDKRKSFMMLEPGLIKQTLSAHSPDASSDELSDLCKLNALANVKISTYANEGHTSSDSIKELSSSATKVGFNGVQTRDMLTVQQPAAKLSFKDDASSTDALPLEEQTSSVAAKVSLKDAPSTNSLTVKGSALATPKVGFKEGIMSTERLSVMGSPSTSKVSFKEEGPGADKLTVMDPSFSATKVGFKDTLTIFEERPSVKKPSEIKFTMSDDSYEIKPAITKSISLSGDTRSSMFNVFYCGGRKCPQWVNKCLSKLKKLDIREWSARELDRTFFCLGFLSVTFVEVTVFVYYEVYHTEVKRS